MKHASSAGFVVLSVLALGCSGGKSGPSGPQLSGPFTVAFSPSTVNPGNGSDFSVTLPTGVPTGSLLLLQLSFEGQRGAVDTVTVPQEYGTLAGSLSIPDGFPDGVITLVATLPALNDTASGTLQILDTDPPALTDSYMLQYDLPFQVEMTAGAPMLLAGTTDSVLIDATDNGSLAWVGFSLGSPANIADSMSIRELSVHYSQSVTVPTAWLGSTPLLTVFASDRDGNRATQSLGYTAVAAHVTRPVRTVALDTSVRDGVYDTKRGVVYLAVGDQPVVQVLSLASMTYGTPLPIPVPAADLDVRPGGDSLIVALANTGDLAIINLATPGPASIVHLNSLNATPGDTTSVIGAMQAVRVASDGRIVVGVNGGPGSGYGATVGAAQLDPSTGHDSILALGMPRQVTMTRSGDGTKVLVGQANLIYHATTHAYEMTQHVVENGQASADLTGAIFAVDDQLYDSTCLNLGIADAETENPIFPPSLLSSAGTEFYVGLWNGLPYYIRFRVPVTLNPTLNPAMIGVPLDVVDAPEGIKRFVALADTTSLLALGADQAMLFDLTQSSPSTRRVRTALHATPRRATETLPTRMLPPLRLQVGHSNFNVMFHVEASDDQPNHQTDGRH